MFFFSLAQGRYQELPPVTCPEISAATICAALCGESLCSSYLIREKQKDTVHRYTISIPLCSCYLNVLLSSWRTFYGTKPSDSLLQSLATSAVWTKTTPQTPLSMCHPSCSESEFNDSSSHAVNENSTAICIWNCVPSNTSDIVGNLSYIRLNL